MKEQQTTKTTIIYGIILGLIQSFHPLYSFFVDKQMYFNPTLRILLLVSIPFLGLISIIAVRKSNTFLSFKNAFKNYTLTIALGLFISTISSLLVFNILDTNFHKTIREVGIKSTESKKDLYIEKMEKNGATKEDINIVIKSQLDYVANLPKENQYTIQKQISNFFISLTPYLVFGLIFSGLLKKNKPELI